MATETITAVDCDGHIMESMEEMAEYAHPSIRDVFVNPRTFFRTPFPTLDGIHWPNPAQYDPNAEPRKRVNASDHRMGSAEDWQSFLEKANVEQTVLFTSDGLTVGFLREPNYTIAICQAYNDYVAERYRQLDKRLHPMALIPMQKPAEAVKELRRAVKDLDLPGAMLPATGLPLDLGHEDYWPVYKEAASLGATLAVHGGSNLGIGMDTVPTIAASHILHHPLPLAIHCVSMIYNKVFDQYRDLRVAFMEGGSAWTVLILDRMQRDAGYHTNPDRTFEEYLASGQILIGCEGEDTSLPYLAKRVGIEPFAYSSDYPHEVDFASAVHEIEETVESKELTDSQKVAVLRENAKRFFRL